MGLSWITIFIIGLGGCTTGDKMSETVADKSAGVNGSFEYTKSSFPVNWLLYTEKTVESGDFDILIDTDEFKDGKQSLKFVVRKCSDTGGRLSPGFCQEFKANPGETYNISFWAKNHGSEFVSKVSGVSAFQVLHETVVGQSNEKIDDWRLFECEYKIPEKMEALRFELNILHPGTFWIDDVRIKKITD